MDGHRRHPQCHCRRMGPQRIPQGPFRHGDHHCLAERNRQSRKPSRQQYRFSDRDRYPGASGAHRILPRLRRRPESLRLLPPPGGRRRKSRHLQESRLAGGGDAGAVPRQWTLVRDAGSRDSQELSAPDFGGATFQLRADFFNSLNRTNFSVGGSHNPNSTQFGSISSAFSAREVQVGAKIIF